MNANVNDAFLEKLRKLKAKADDVNISEEEALLYANKVAELLQQRNLDEAILDIKPVDGQDVIEDYLFNGRTHVQWAKSMCLAIAKLYFCDLYCSKNRATKRTSVVFVGKPHNIQVARGMAVTLMRTVCILANRYAASTGGKEQFTTRRNGFERGAGMRLAQRIIALHKEQTKEAPQRSANGNPQNLPALYQDEDALIAAYMKALALAQGKARPMKYNLHNAQGAIAADGISLNQQIGTKASAMMIGRSK